MEAKSLKKIIKNLLIFILLIALTFGALLKNQDMKELFDTIRKVDKRYILLGIIFMFLYLGMESVNVKYILKAFGEKISIEKAYKYTLIGFFFSSITPAASGGQPVEIYYMTKDNVSGAKATVALLVHLCSFQISTILLGIISAIANHNLFNNALLGLFILGVTLNGIVLSIMLICIISHRLSEKLINIVLKILSVLRIKNIEKISKKMNDGLKKYEESSVYIKEHKTEFFKSILRVIVQVFFYYSIPYFVYKSFGLNTYNLLNIISIQAILFLTVSSIPLPGAVGISEAVFLGIYETVFSKQILSSAMLVNRGISFYLFVVLAGVISMINALKMSKNLSNNKDN